VVKVKELSQRKKNHYSNYIDSKLSNQSALVACCPHKVS